MNFVCMPLCLFLSEAWVVSPGCTDELDRGLHSQHQLEAEPAPWPALHINIDMVSYSKPAMVCDKTSI